MPCLQSDYPLWHVPVVVLEPYSVFSVYFIIIHLFYILQVSFFFRMIVTYEHL